METFAAPKKLVENPHFSKQRTKCLADLSDDRLDPPMIEIVHGFNRLPFCFTLQSCCGHFLYGDQMNPQNLDPLPVTKAIARVEYRIAYLAFCVENSDSGRRLIDRLKKITDIDPQNIQFCSAEWFWQKQVNTYSLQVEPDRFKHQDTAILDYPEALALEKTQNAFFFSLRSCLESYNRIR